MEDCMLPQFFIKLIMVRLVGSLTNVEAVDSIGERAKSNNDDVHVV